MRFTDKIKYNIKRGLPILAIAGAGLMSSCDKDDEPEMPIHDVEIPFDLYTADNVLAFPILQKYVSDPSVRTIYLTAEVEREWENFTPANIQDCRTRFLQPRIELSKKIRGKGDFLFPVGIASQVPNDSLWIVQQGWTINKRFQNQK